MFIIDFDDTLFDTHRFKKYRQDLLSTIGIDENIYKESYLKARTYENELMSYTNQQHAKILGTVGFDEKLVCRLLEKSMKKAKSFLFDGAVDFIKYFKEYNKKIILLSLGQPSFQKEKVKACGIDKYFDEIIYVNDSKRKVLKKMLNKSDNGIWLVNDKIGEYKGLINEFPGVNIVLKKSSSISEEEYKKSKLPYFNTLKEIQDYVSSQLK